MMKIQPALVAFVLVVVVAMLSLAEANQTDDAKCRKYAKDDGFTDVALAKVGPMTLVSSIGWTCHGSPTCCTTVCNEHYYTFWIEVENKNACCCGAEI